MYERVFEVESLSTAGFYNVRLEHWREMEAAGEKTRVHVETFGNVGWVTARSEALFVTEVSRALPDGSGRYFERLGDYGSLQAAVDAIREAYDENRDAAVAWRRVSARSDAGPLLQRPS
jgi:hypothetical protein